jgi:hypothetical protein
MWRAASEWVADPLISATREVCDILTMHRCQGMGAYHCFPALSQLAGTKSPVATQSPSDNLAEGTLEQQGSHPTPMTSMYINSEYPLRVANSSGSNVCSLPLSIRFQSASPNARNQVIDLKQTNGMENNHPYYQQDPAWVSYLLWSCIGIICILIKPLHI